MVLGRFKRNTAERRRVTSLSRYKLEIWRNGKYLVYRTKKGNFAKRSRVYKVTEQQDGLMVAVSRKTTKYSLDGIKWTIKKPSLIKEREIITEQPQQKKGIELYRASYVLNNIPISKDGYFGFRIVAFSTNKALLHALKDRMKSRLIKFIKDCIRQKWHFSSHDLWFNTEGGDYKMDLCYGYEAPRLNNIEPVNNNKYFCTLEDKYGAVLRGESGELRSL